MPVSCSKALPGFRHPEAHRKVIAIMVFWRPSHIKLLFEALLVSAYNFFLSNLPSSQDGAAVTCFRGAFATTPMARLPQPVQLSLRVLFVGGPRLYW